MLWGKVLERIVYACRRIVQFKEGASWAYVSEAAKMILDGQVFATGMTNDDDTFALGFLSSVHIQAHPLQAWCRHLREYTSIAPPGGYVIAKGFCTVFRNHSLLPHLYKKLNMFGLEPENHHALRRNGRKLQDCMTSVWEKTVLNCFLGLIIQTFKILGLELLEVLWNGICKQG